MVTTGERFTIKTRVGSSDSTHQCITFGTCYAYLVRLRTYLQGLQAGESVKRSRLAIQRAIDRGRRDVGSDKSKV